MIARLTNGPLVPEGEDRHDIYQFALRRPAQFLRFAPVGGSAGWARLDLTAPAWTDAHEQVAEAWYELAHARPLPDLDAGEEVWLYLLAEQPVPVPWAEWQGKGSAATQKMRVVALEAGGVVVAERTAGAENLHRPIRFLVEQLRAAYEPTGLVIPEDVPAAPATEAGPEEG